MSIFAISDLHLSTLDKTDKSMEVFGKRWDNYMMRIENNWKKLVGENDTVIIPGDISWALKLEDTLADLRFIDALPGKKVFLKGNHDLWWSTMKKLDAFFEENGIKTIKCLFKVQLN